MFLFIFILFFNLKISVLKLFVLQLARNLIHIISLVILMSHLFEIKTSRLLAYDLLWKLWGIKKFLGLSGTELKSPLFQPVA
jgi:hypothetical protein